MQAYPTSRFSELLIVHGCLRNLSIERSPIGDTAPHELRPGWNRNIWGDRLWQQAPKLGVKPAQVMSRTVAMCTDTRAQSLYFRNQRFEVHYINIFVHSRLPIVCDLEVQR